MSSPGKAISRIYWYTQGYIDKKLRIHGIGTGEVAILMELKRTKRMTQKEIADRLHVDKTTISREVRKLMKNGYIVAIRDERDKRKKIISLSPEGKKIIPVIKKVLEEWKEILLHDFSPSERDAIFRALNRMEKNAVNAMEGIK